MTWFYNILIGIGGVIIGLLAFANEMGDKVKYLRAFRSLFFKIPFFILGSGLIIAGTILKDIDNEQKQEELSDNHILEINRIDSINRLEKKVADSTNQNKMQELIDSSYVKSLRASNEALAKYNLRFIDSLHSVASTINTKNSMAQLAIDAVDQRGVPPIYLTDKGENKILNVRYISSDATSYNIRINIYIFKELSQRALLLQHIIDPGGYNFLVPGRNRTMALTLDPTVSNSDTLLVIFMGRFSRDENGKEMIEFKSAYSFDFSRNQLLKYRPTINYLAIIDYLDKKGIPRLK